MKNNIMIIVMDSVRKDFLSLYGHPKNTSPFLECLANDAAIYENAITACGWTLPSISSILTGCYLPPSTKVINYLKNEMLFLPEILNNNGYASYCISDNPFLNPDFFGHVFGHVYNFNKNNFGRVLNNRCILKSVIQKVKNGLKFKEGMFVEQIKHILNLHTNNDPFFLLAHFDATHFPYSPPKKLFDKYMDNSLSKEHLKKIRDKQIQTRGFQDPHEHLNNKELIALTNIYEGIIAYMDSVLEQIIMFMKQKKCYKDTLIVIIADHGDFLGEHGLFGHIGVLYDELIRVPLVIKYPDDYLKKARVKNLVSLIDIFPTVLHTLNIEINSSSNYKIQGLPLQKIKDTNRDFVISRYIFGENFQFDPVKVKKRFPQFADCEKYIGEQTAIITDKYKYINFSNGNHMLFDYEDSGENENVVNDKSDIAQILQEKYYDFTELIPYKRHDGAVEEVEHSKNIESQLKALGYID